MGFFFLSFFVLQSLDLPGLYEQSTQHVTRLRIEESKLKEARAGNREALGEILPNVSFLGSYTRQDKGGTTSSQNETNGRLSAKQPLFRGFQEFFALSAAKAGARAQEYSLQWAKALLMKDIAKLYFSILQTESAERLMKEQVELTEKRVKNLQAWEKIGRAKKSEYLSAQSRLGLVEADLLSIQQDLLELRLNLPALAGVPSQTILKDSVKAPSDLAPLETYLNPQNRGDVQEKMEAVEAARKLRAAAWSAHFPTIDAEGNYYLKRSGNLKGVDWDISLNLEVPIFSGGSVLARRQQADEQVFQRQKEFEQAVLDSRKEVESLFNKIQNLKSQVTILKRAAEETKASYAEQNRDYQRGMVTNLEVLEALSTYIDTQKRWKNSIYDLQQARLDLDLASGVLKP